MKLYKIALASLLVTGALYARNYDIDRDHSSIGFKVKHMMISNIKGRFDAFSGIIAYDEYAKFLVRLDGKIDVDSIDTNNEKRDTHLKSADFFDAKKYPDITFELIRTAGGYAYGRLTMHGITKEVKLKYKDNGVIKDPQGNQKIGISLEGKINRADFDLKYNSTLEDGGVLIGEDVEIDIDIEGALVK